MKQFKNRVHSRLLIIFCLSAWLGQAQQSKTYKESFNVGPEVEVSLNTSHADVEFETWDKNTVAVEAVIKLEGATEEEAAEYFKDHGIEIMGSSSRVEVRTRRDQNWVYDFSGQRMEFDFEFPDVDIPDIAPILENIEIPDVEAMSEFAVLAEMPPMPPMPPFANFDYEAYEEDGEKYMKKWQKEFEKSFDKEYRKQIEEWAKMAGERAEAMVERMEARNEDRQVRMEERAERMEETQKQREEIRAQLEEAREAMREAREESREAMREAQQQARKEQRKMLEEREKAKVFYMQGERNNRNFTIEKRIKIKMPKGAKIKLDVRHGEVKLAENARDLRANLSYASLLASNIEGEQTLVNARYSPVLVKQWRSGRLDTDFSEDVTLELVRRLNLRATSSVISIDRISEQASIRNDLGSLRIGSIDNGFENMTVSVQNGDVECVLPEGDFEIALQNQGSRLEIPSFVVWDEKTYPESGKRTGFRGKRDSGRSIVINASYSKEDLHD